MLVISRNLGRKGVPLWHKASCCLWQLKYNIKFRDDCQELFYENQNLAVLTLMPGPMVEATTQLLIY